MFDWIKKIMSKGIWYTLAIIVVAFAAGPEILISMELMVLVEFLGTSTFVLMYVSGLKLFLSKAFNSFFKPLLFPIYKDLNDDGPPFGVDLNATILLFLRNMRLIKKEIPQLSIERRKGREVFVIFRKDGN